MSGGLVAVSTTGLERLRDAVRNQRISAFTHSDLVGFGVKEQLDALVGALQGHSRAACLSILDAVLAERAAGDRPSPELVWTGPEGDRASARDTAVVLRELFEGARNRVVLAGYSFRDARDVLGPLHQSMMAHGVKAHFFVDIQQAETVVADTEAYAQKAMNEFIRENWVFKEPYPDVYCDRRALHPGPPWCSLHAKCVSMDGERALVSSANFTMRGQERNIETGVLLHDAAVATQLERQWMGLVGSGHVVKWRLEV